MIGRLRTYFLIAAAVFLLALPLPALAKGWEAVRSDVSSLSSVARDSEVEVRVAPGHVVVITSQQMPVKIFTILGQVVANDTLPAGTSRLALPHGVYIVKVGEITCKIAV